MVTPPLAPALLLALLVLGGCASTGNVDQAGAPAAHTPRPVHVPPSSAKPEAPAMPAAGSGRGGYYKDDGPGDNPPANLLDVPDAALSNDPLLPRSNRPYVVLGKTYTPITNDTPYTQRGMGTWYGKKFHGQRTSSGEVYDMYKMTAAHPTLPIPSYARLTDIASGKQVIVRINDRGPFHSNRIVDVSYTAALKLGMLAKGSHELLLERVMPDEIERMRAAQNLPQQQGGDGGKVAAAMAPNASGAAPVVMTSAAPRAPVVPTSTQMPATSGAASVAVTSGSAPLPATSGSAPLPATSGSVPMPATSGSAPVPATSGSAPVPATSALAPVLASAETRAEPGPAATVPVAAESAPAALASGYYLQLGAFTHAENADAAMGKFKPYAGSLAMLSVVQSELIYRVYSGPYASRADASKAAQEIPASMGIKPLVVTR